MAFKRQWVASGVCYAPTFFGAAFRRILMTLIFYFVSSNRLSQGPLERYDGYELGSRPGVMTQNCAL